ncbi:MAG: ABC transporter substrate-binding protein [bacterium]|nr:ABC transporter substrate-binding protein [bacterium]
MKIPRTMLMMLFAVIVLFIPFILQADTAKKVLLAVYYDNPEYSICRNTFQEGLAKEAGKAGLNVEFLVLDTQGSKELFLSQLKKMEQDIDLVFSAGTPNCLAVKEAGFKKPVIFTAVADPVGASLVESLVRPNTNFTGSHCAVSADRQLSALLYVIPGSKKIGFLYNAEDPSPVSQVQAWKEAMARIKMKAIEFKIPPSANSIDSLADAAKPIIGKVDVLVTLADAKVSAFGEGIIAVANVHKIPTYASLNSLIKKGALCSLGFDFKTGAAITVSQAVDILKGSDPATIPVITNSEYRLVINLNTARVIGLEIPANVIKTAAEVVE